MNVIDSSVWIAYTEESAEAEEAEKYFQKADQVMVPTLVIHEVYRQLLKKLDRQEAIFYVGQMEKGKVVPLDQEIALFAAEIRRQHGLGTADAVIYATALIHDAPLVTLDNDFRNLPQCVMLG
ncbi:MAG TPA: type II toxin-antitoxin system VapC family toxin [bacterium]|nr:type II toxin-antitoxin system VapC family toxin [bacterium]